MPDTLAELRAALFDRYAIDRELGRGGMATVYLARDLKHGRSVALKVLRSDVAASIGSERFLREIHTAAQLQHPHILPLHDSGDADGLLYYVMPFVDGETLRDRLHRERQLPLDEALRITREVADALAYAHRLGVVHRDIKPENILLSGAPEGGHAQVSDFGIARALFEQSDQTLTLAGVAVGTPAYMSPEQASAERDVDGRADLYSLGCVLYEMLAGHAPFLGTTAQEILARHARDPVPPLRTARPELPPVVERVVQTALSKAPADRFATASAFMLALTTTQTRPATRHPVARWGVPAALALAAVASAYALLSGSRTSSSAASGAQSEASIAVLPFENIGGVVGNEPFSDGVAEDLTTELRKVASLIVKARTSAFSFKGKDLTGQEIGRRLGAQYVVTGSVQLSGPRRRVNAQLIDVATGNELWSDRYDSDASAENIFAVQDTITRAIVVSLRVPLSATESASLEKRSTMNREAHDLYLQGRYFFEKRDEASLAKAKDYFERAIRVDSSYARAWAGLSDALGHSSAFGYVAPRAIRDRAKSAALRSLALDSMLVEGHTSLGFVSLFLDLDRATAGRAFNRALELDPRYAPAHLFHGWYFVAANRPADALEELRTAVGLDPFSLVINARVTSMLYYARRYDAAITQARRTLELDSLFTSALAEYVRALLFNGRCEEAESVIGRQLEQRAVFTGLFRGFAGLVYVRCGHRARALSEIDRLRAEEATGRYLSHVAVAMIYAGLEDENGAFRELERAIEQGEWGLFTLRLEPAFDNLRDDPRFSRILTRVGLVP